MKFQDIHLADQSLYTQLKQMFAARQYSQAIQSLQNTQLTDKVLNAEAINYVTGKLVEVQNLDDPDFSKDLIEVSTTAPADISSSEVWFQINN